MVAFCRSIQGRNQAFVKAKSLGLPKLGMNS